MPLGFIQTIGIAAYFLAPFVLLRLRRRWGVPATILSLWLPLEFRLLPAVAVLVGIVAAILAFDPRRDRISIWQQFAPAEFSLKGSLSNLGMFAVIGIPLGLAIGFIEPGLDTSVLRQVPMLFATTVLYALAEEILFRGIVQYWLENRLKSRIAALFVASVVFGAAHLNNGPALPNYKYFAMASIAGVFYGRAWCAKRNVLTSTLTHSIVNLSWRLFFR